MAIGRMMREQGAVHLYKIGEAPLGAPEVRACYALPVPGTIFVPVGTGPAPCKAVIFENRSLLCEQATIVRVLPTE